MTVQDFYGQLVGDWRGTYFLWLDPNKPPEESRTEVQMRSVAKGAYFLMSYSWTQGGDTQEGVFLMGGRGDAGSATWGDSWHMVPTPMICKGGLQAGGEKLVFQGSYSGGQGQPDWGWRTEFVLRGRDAFIMEAYNISPDGNEEIAVRAELDRVP